MSNMLGDTVSVRIAAVDCPGCSLMASRFHVMVIGPLAFGGFQSLVVMFKASDKPLLMFFMYTV